MTDREAFAAVLELARKHSLPVVPDGWKYEGPRWIRNSEADGLIYDLTFGNNATDLDLQALTGVLTDWLAKQGVDIVWFVDNYGIHSFAHGGFMNGESHPTRLQAQLAALRHVTDTTTNQEPQ